MENNIIKRPVPYRELKIIFGIRRPDVREMLEAAISEFQAKDNGEPIELEPLVSLPTVVRYLEILQENGIGLGFKIISRKRSEGRPTMYLAAKGGGTALQSGSVEVKVETLPSDPLESEMEVAPDPVALEG